MLLAAISVLALVSGAPLLVKDAQASIGGISLGNVAITLPTATVTPTPVPQPVASIFTANPSLNTLSIFTVGSSGNAQSLFAQTLLSNPQGIAYFGGNLYVANQATDTITVYPANSNGSVNPIVTITGSNTQLNDPDSIALDSSGNIYVSNRGSLNGNPDSVNVFSAGSNGNVAPTAVITGPNTGLQLPAALALDSQGNIYVANAGSTAGGADTITVYSPGTNGNSSPVRTISGSSTGLNSPAGIAIDSSGYVYVSSGGAPNASTVSVLIYSPGSSGNVAPVTSVDGDCQAFAAPGALTLANGNLYATSPGDLSTFNESVTVNSGVSTASVPAQCLSPDTIVFGPNTQIDQPYGIAVDTTGNMYATHSESNSITVLSPGAGMNSLPSAIIATTSNVVNPTSVALDSKGNIYVANAGVQVGLPDSVNAYYAASNANATPYFVIGGGGPADLSQLSDPVAIAVGSDNRVYVANATAGYQQNGAITIYSIGLGTPLYGVSGTSTSDKTGLHDPVAVALDSGNNLYVLNSSGGPDGAGSITVYANANITGYPFPPWNFAPSRTIANTTTSALTQFQSPAGMTLHGNSLYVTNDGSISGDSGSITIYPTSGKGNIAPTAVISGANTGLNLPQGIALDKNGYIYVANNGSANGGVDTITVYAPGSSGNAIPVTTLTGPLTGLGLPSGIAVGP